jgi:hypothetical protein
MNLRRPTDADNTRPSRGNSSRFACKRGPRKTTGTAGADTEIHLKRQLNVDFGLTEISLQLHFQHADRITVSPNQFSKCRHLGITL